MWWGTAVESPDPAAAAAFYSKLWDWPVVHQDPGTSVLSPPQESVFVVFQLADDYVRPAWPPVVGQQRTMMHRDVQVDDLEAAVADAERLGAELAKTQPQANVRVMFDPDRPSVLSAAKSTDGRRLSPAEAPIAESARAGRHLLAGGTAMQIR
jgi:Glyoxalase-like domain